MITPLWVARELSNREMYVNRAGLLGICKQTRARGAHCSVFSPPFWNINIARNEARRVDHAIGSWNIDSNCFSDGNSKRAFTHPPRAFQFSPCVGVCAERPPPILRFVLTWNKNNLSLRCDPAFFGSGPLYLGALSNATDDLLWIAQLFQPRYTAFLIYHILLHSPSFVSLLRSYSSFFIPSFFFILYFLQKCYVRSNCKKFPIEKHFLLVKSKRWVFIIWLFVGWFE